MHTETTQTQYLFQKIPIISPEELYRARNQFEKRNCDNEYQFDHRPAFERVMFGVLMFLHPNEKNFLESYGTALSLVLPEALQTLHTKNKAFMKSGKKRQNCNAEVAPNIVR